MTNSNSNKLIILVFVLYVLFTIPVLLQHMPWFDEVHAWYLAKFMTLTNYREILSAEGHPILWFLCIMPFAKLLPHTYPYSMLIINYLFCIFALFILWKKSNFNLLIKLSITFSPLFIYYFPIVARGYSLGILGLFILSGMYNEKTKYPILYSCIIAIVMHTNIIVCIAASYFLFIFCYELYRDKQILQKNKYFAFGILIFSLILLVAPFINGYGDDASRLYGKPSLTYFINFFSDVYLLILIPCYIWLCKNSKRTLSFLLYTTSLNIILYSCFYSGRAHHFIFFIIYLIIGVWIAEKQIQNKLFTALFCLLILIPYNWKMQYCYYWNEIQSHTFIDGLNNDTLLDNKILYVDKDFLPIVPYIKSNITVKNGCTFDDFNYKNISLFCDVQIVKSNNLFKEADEVYYLTYDKLDNIKPYGSYSVPNIQTTYLYKFNKENTSLTGVPYGKEN